MSRLVYLDPDRRSPLLRALLPPDSCRRVLLNMYVIIPLAFARTWRTPTSPDARIWPSGNLYRFFSLRLVSNANSKLILSRKSMSRIRSQPAATQRVRSGRGCTANLYFSLLPKFGYHGLNLYYVLFLVSIFFKHCLFIWPPLFTYHGRQNQTNKHETTRGCAPRS